MSQAQQNPSERDGRASARVGHPRPGQRHLAVPRDRIAGATLDHALWVNLDAVPPTRVAVSWGDAAAAGAGAALVCRMTTREPAPLTRFTRANDPVCRDSCLEFFLAPWPGSGHYLNLEANSAGVFYAAFGTTVARGFLDERDRALVGCVPEVGGGEWSITWTVPQALLDRLADLAARPAVVLAEGLVVEANFYRCGDDLERPHYAAWNRIEAASPQFHRPDQFGRLQLG